MYTSTAGCSCDDGSGAAMRSGPCCPRVFVGHVFVEGLPLGSVGVAKQPVPLLTVVWICTVQNAQRARSLGVLFAVRLFYFVRGPRLRDRL